MEQVQSAALAPRPDHVPLDRVIEFDLYALPGGEDDAQAAYWRFQQDCPEVFWTPFNGGHWVATRADIVEAMLRDPSTYSSNRVFLPRDDNAPRTVPLEADPPVHTEMRKPLSRGLFPKAVDAMEPSIRELATSLIDGFVDRGGCEFVGEFANVFPMNIFLDLIELPRTEREVLLPIVEAFIKGGSIEVRNEAQMKLFAYIGEVVRQRRVTPGDDLGSMIVNSTVAGERIGEMEAISYMTLLLLGGLDTIASMLSFITKFLAEHPEHRRALVANLEDDVYVKRAMEELFRRFGIVNAGRVLTRDVEVAGATLRANDTVFPVNLLVGLDDRLHDDPLKVDFGREKSARHLTFGAGPHSCPGSQLARREITIFLREWLRRIPDFAVKPGTRPKTIMGVTISLHSLDLVWP
ncbi:cytochrome P450 [Novosphingobium sp. JCM 18896]|uniref:cytochrome P450 n=1 Tax=Novosphingobium sp. JCM 18896 TaxID=2989731 RepID=UPI00222178AA|nr:cytochrome P450 [Novosphingobium sp. JCM 18896]MCW1432329.1 cytochrome P450 [Novosphingobium sp. JCM 18896]